MLDDYERQLLDAWEEVFKKGQLSMWILLALKNGPKHMAEIKQFLESSTNGALSADDKSLYRALRRYYDTEMVDYHTVPGEGGPERKVYKLTATGKRVLQTFISRNFIQVFYQPRIKALIEKEI